MKASWRLVVVGWFALAGPLAAASHAGALSAGNVEYLLADSPDGVGGWQSQVWVELQGVPDGSGGYVPALGIHDWTVEGVLQMEREWFWGRDEDSPEGALDTLGLDSHTVLDTDGDGAHDFLRAVYSDAYTEVELRLSLLGGLPGSGWSDLVEQIRISNLSEEENQHLYVFQYTDFDLSGTAHGDELGVLHAYGNAYAIGQEDEACCGAVVGLTPPAGAWQAGDAQDLLALLADESPTTLDGTDYVFGGADVDPACIVGWNGVLGPGQSVILSVDKLIMPEPATLTLMGAGFGVVALLRRRRRGRT